MSPRQRLLTAFAAFLANAAPLWADSPTIVDTRGPVINAGMNVQVDAEGVQAPGYKFPEPAAATPWTGKWIGSSAPRIDHAACTLLRQEVVLDAEPQKVTARMTSGNYLLFVNGRQAARGPADAGHDFAGTSSKLTFYDTRDLTPLLHQGKNVLAAEIFDGGFLFEAKVAYADGRTVTLQTDESWRGTSCPFLQRLDRSADPMLAGRKGLYLAFDANAEPLGWLLAGFDDSAWPACHSGNPPAPLLASELPPLMDARYPFFKITHATPGITIPEQPFTKGQPVVVTKDGDFNVHFDKIMAGRCGLAVVGVKGAKLYLDSNETDGPPGGKTYEITLRDGLQYFESPDYYALGTLLVRVRGVTSPVRILDVSAISVSQPVAYQGAFTCSDEALNALWKSCRWSTQICMQTLHLDSPQHQEPIGDYGDYLIADLVNYVSMGDNIALARQDLRKFARVLENAKYQTFHTSYMLLWLQSLLNYYDQTGDKYLVEELAPQVHGLLDQFTSYLGRTGIISEAPNYMFMDWVSINGVACHHPPAVIGQGYLTAFYYKGLDDARRVSEITGDQPRAIKYAGLRQQVAEAYNRELWNPAQGLYRDGKPFVTSVQPGKWLPADTQMETFSAQNNALAVLYDLAPPERQKAVIDKLMAASPLNVTPYFMHFVLSAIAHAGLFSQYGTELMRGWKIQPDTQTVLENNTRGDHSHGWIATPTYQMSSRLLGVTPGAPGWDTIRIQPTPADLTFARGIVPTPHGPVSVGWTRHQDAFSLKVTIPAGTSATVDFPVGSAEKPTVSAAGKLIWNQTSPGEAVPGLKQVRRTADAVEMQVPAGTYEFQGSQLALPGRK